MFIEQASLQKLNTENFLLSAYLDNLIRLLYLTNFPIFHVKYFRSCHRHHIQTHTKTWRRKKNIINFGNQSKKSHTNENSSYRVSSSFIKMYVNEEEKNEKKSS